MGDLKKEILLISRRPENSVCVDCRMPQPTWASFNLGVFMCMTCAGIHRSLGTHITRVRSVTMDNWDAPSVALMGNIGNIRGNSYFEAKLPPHLRLHPGVDDRSRSEFIKAKYVNRQWYGVPAGGSESANEPQETKVLSKMEQRQARLQARGAAATTAANTTQTATIPAAAATSTIPPPANKVRQTSVPISSSQSSTLTGTSASLFSGMAVSSTAAASATTAVPVKVTSGLAPKITSASPWVSRDEHQQVVQQQQQSQPLHTHSLPVTPIVTAPATVNLLDFSAPEQPAPQPASSGHAVDDMFAGLSVSNGVPTEPTATAAPSVNISSSELLSFYAHEPASAPARAQHSPPITATTTNVTQPTTRAPASDVFSFIDQPAAVSQPTSSFSFMSEEPAAPPSSSTDSAFSFLGGASVDPTLPDMNTLIVLPGQFGGPTNGLLDSNFSAQPLPTMPMQMNMPLTNVGYPPANPNFLNPLSAPTLTHSYSQPIHGNTELFGAPNQMNVNGYPPYMNGGGVGGAAPMMNGGGLMPGGGMGLGGLGGFPSSTPQFTVQSVQAAQRAQQQQAADLAADPFAHIQVTQAQPQQPQQAASLGHMNGYPGVNQLQAPKGPNQCDVDGCSGTKVSRGLCSKHINGTVGAVAAPASNPDSTFAFLSTSVGAAAIQQQAGGGDGSNFSFLTSSASAPPPTTIMNETSSFAFI